MYGIFSTIKHQTYLLYLTLNQFHWIKFYFICMIVCDCGGHTKLNRDFPDFPPNDMNKYTFFIAYSYPFITIVCKLNRQKIIPLLLSFCVSSQFNTPTLFYSMFFLCLFLFFSFHCRVSSFWMTDKDIYTRVHWASSTQNYSNNWSLNWNYNFSPFFFFRLFIVS